MQHGHFASFVQLEYGSATPGPLQLFRHVGNWQRVERLLRGADATDVGDSGSHSLTLYKSVVTSSSRQDARYLVF
jgi:hypothetical protein